jgi:peptidoglycan/LPS O-acetylase OafA/YrhL
MSGRAAYSYKYFGTLRLFLAAMVLLQHFSAETAPEGTVHQFLLPYEVGSLAVLVFFCLSGFVISEAVHKLYLDQPVAYLANRLLRIAPHYVIAVAISIGIYYVFARSGTLRVGRDAPLADEFVTTAFAMRDVVLNCFGFLPVNYFVDYDFLDNGWAVRVEMVFYTIVFACVVALQLPIVRRIGFVALARGALVLIVPLVVAAALHRAPAKLGFIAYFGYGSALYFATAGYRAARPFVWLCVAGIMLHFLAQPARNPGAAFLRDVPVQCVLLCLLLGLMTFLAFARFTDFRRADRALGDLSYPLYLYHQGVMVLALSMTVGYGYGVFVAGMAVSVLVAYAAARLVDPLANRVRDRVRGMTLGAPAAAVSPDAVAIADLAEALPVQTPT